MAYCYYFTNNRGCRSELHYIVDKQVTNIAWRTNLGIYAHKFKHNPNAVVQISSLNRYACEAVEITSSEITVGGDLLKATRNVYLPLVFFFLFHANELYVNELSVHQSCSFMYSYYDFNVINIKHMELKQNICLNSDLRLTPTRFLVNK